MPTLIRSLMAGAALAMAACTTAPDEAAPQATAAAPAAKSTLETAIDAAGGEAALSRVKELYWTGKATVTTGGKVTRINVQTVVRPGAKWARSTSWLEGAQEKTARTLQVEQGKAWDVNRVSWSPLPAAQAENENQQFGLYALMLLTPLKAADAKVEDLPPASDGTRAIRAVLPGKVWAELAFDASGRLVGAGNTVTNPATGAADIVQTITFSGTVESNGVKWPKKMTIEQNGQPFYELEIAAFEASPEFKTRPMAQSMQYESGAGNPGEENAG
jgi:hypothetical protein